MDAEGPLEVGEQPFGDPPGRFEARQVGEEHDELVAAQAGDEFVGAHVLA